MRRKVNVPEGCPPMTEEELDKGMAPWADWVEEALTETPGAYVSVLFGDMDLEDVPADAREMVLSMLGLFLRGPDKKMGPLATLMCLMLCEHEPPKERMDVFREWGRDLKKEVLAEMSERN